MCDDGLSNPLELHISCKNLVNLDFGSKTDPFAVVYSRAKEGGIWTEVGRTEQIKDSLNPVFVKQITMKYLFETRQMIKIEVWDVDDPNAKTFDAQELVGTVEIVAAELVRNKTMTLPLKHPNRPKNGDITILADHIKSHYSSNLVKMQLTMDQVKIHESLFFKIYRDHFEPVAPGMAPPPSGATKIPVYQSESLRKDKRNMIEWKPVKIGAAALMRDNMDLPLTIELLEYKSNGDHKIIDSQSATFNRLVDNSFAISTKIGRIFVKGVEHIKRASFMEYLLNGANIMLNIGIDFTGSNGNPQDSFSLHSLRPNKNQYLPAIIAVGKILEMYDTDKMIPAFGFGCKLPGLLETYMCFSLNGNMFAPEVYTIAGVEKLYTTNMPKLTFSGPTNFAPIINYVGDMAQFYASHGLINNYLVLLLLTDGNIDDINETIDAIIRCSLLPVSIVIVGVGDSDFSAMDVLDADKGKLMSRTNKTLAARDIVQFVPFSKYAHDPQELARVTLAEIPGQFAEYAAMAKIDPAMISMIPPNPLNFYQVRSSDFATQLEMQGFARENILSLMKTGFPVEDLIAFRKALQTGYSNQLAIPQ